MRSVVTLLILLAGMGTTPTPANADIGVGGSSTLSPWTLDGELMVHDGYSDATWKDSLPCPDIHAAIDEFNNDPGPGEPGSPPPDEPELDLTWPLSDSEVEILWHYVDYEWTFSAIKTCTTMLHDGYKPATSALVNLIDNPGPIIKITAEGETTCDYGEVLISDAFYYYSPYSPEWISGYGKNWEEVFHAAPGFEVHGELTLYCLEIFDEDYDVVKISDQVPTVQVNHDPLVEGLTGIDTWLWYDFTRPGATSQLTLQDSVNAYGRDWVLDANAWIDWIGWDVDCIVDCDFRGMLVDYDVDQVDHTIDFGDTTHSPAPLYDGGTNAEGESAATHVYEVKGDYTLSTVTVWRGFYTFNGLTTLYDPVVVADSVLYDVVEIRSVLGEDG